VQASVYIVVLGGDTIRLPLVGFVPDHPPPAVHEVALVEDQLACDTWPEVILVGFAENATVGGETLPPPGAAGAPPAPASTRFTFDTTIY
jgi:hypothetical protein